MKQPYITEPKSIGVDTRGGLEAERFYQEVIEEWTGKTLVHNWEKGCFEESEEPPVYPVMIDQDISINPTADNHDGHWLDSYSTWTWSNQYGSSGNAIMWDLSNTSQYYYVGFFVPSVTGPAQGDTIDSATLAIEYNSHGGGSAPTTTLYAQSIANASVPSSSNNPSGFTDTASGTTMPTWGSGGSTGNQNIDVQGQSQDVVNLGSWASGNNILFYTRYTQNNNNAYVYIGNRETGGGSQYTYTADYTAAGGGGSSVPVFYHHYRMMSHAR